MKTVNGILDCLHLFEFLRYTQFELYMSTQANTEQARKQHRTIVYGASKHASKVELYLTEQACKHGGTIFQRASKQAR